MPTINLNRCASDMGRAIGDGRLDPVALSEAMLEAAATHKHSTSIYARMTKDRALAEAKAARARQISGTRRGLLDGVPISWKDLFDTAGVKTEAGSDMLKDRVPARDARVLENATRAGLVCLGKTHMTELAFSGLGLNGSTATPPNRHNPALAPGGSSSGAAASVAYGLAAAGIGSDTGGSVRLPSAWNDLVGFKPAHGALSLQGVVPLCARFDTVGPLCQSVEDAAHVFAALSASKAPDLAASSLQNCRFLVLDTPALEPLDDAPQAAFETALARLSSAGATLTHAPSPAIEQAMQLSGVLYTTEAYATWADQIVELGDLMWPRIRERFEAGLTHAGVPYVQAWQELDTLRAAFRNETAHYDGVLLPTVPILPPETAALMDDEAFFVEKNLAALRNTRVGNLMGLAAVTLPTGMPSCGISVMTQAGQEPYLLRLAAAMEKSLS